MLKEQKRILFVSHDSELFGASRSLVSLIIGLKQKGVKCHILIPKPGPLIELLKEYDIDYSVIRYTWWIDFELPKGIRKKIILKFKNVKLFIQNLKTAFKTSFFVKEQKFDIIYSNTSVMIFGVLLSLLSHKKHVWHLREFIHQNGWSFPSNKIFKVLLNNATEEVIFTSNALHQGFEEYLSTKQFHIVYNGLFSDHELEYRRKAKERFLNENQRVQFTFAIIGDINSNKRQVQAIMALAVVVNDLQVPDVKLFDSWEGDNLQLQTLKDLASNLHIAEKVIFSGYVKDTLKVYIESDAVLVCSKFESFGRVAVEAMATLTPVIGYNSTGTAEIIEDKQTGLLYDGDHIDLAAKMQLLIEDEDLYKKLTTEAWLDVKNRFNIESYSSKVLNIIQKS